MLWTFFFLIFIGFYGYSCHYAQKNNKLEELVFPVNGDGKLCGVGELKEYSHLYYIFKHDNMRPRAVCVDKCPEEISSSFNCFGTQYVDKSECQSEFSTTGKGYIGYGTHTLFKKFCFPDIDKLPSSIDRKTYDNLVGEFGLDDVQEMAEDIFESGKVFLYCFATLMVVSIGYSFFIYIFTGFIVWASILLTGVCLIALSFLLHNYRNENYGPDSDVSEQNYGHLVHVGVVALWTLSVVYFLAICCLYSNITVSIAVLKTSAQVLVQNMRVIFLPFIAAMVLSTWVVFWVY